MYNSHIIDWLCWTINITLVIRRERIYSECCA